MTTGEPASTQREEILRNLRIKVLVSRRFVLDQSWNYDLVSPFWRLYVQSRSGAWIRWSGQRWDLEPGRLYLLPAWLRFQTKTDALVDQAYLHFSLTGIPPQLHRRMFDRPVALSVAPALSGLLEAWRSGLNDTGEGVGLSDSLRASALAHAALAELTDHVPPERLEEFFRYFSEVGPLQPALIRLNERLDSPPSVAELAELCSLGCDHFIRVFRARTGTTPVQYSLDRRMDEAATLLAETGRSIKDIAEATGFVDRFHFSKAAKSRLGLPPAQYRRLHRGHAGGEPGTRFG